VLSQPGAELSSIAEEIVPQKCDIPRFPLSQ